jgi:N-acetylmuramoyl-L-alanine amidase
MVDLRKLRFPDLAQYMGRNPNSSGTFAKGRPVGILLHYTAGGPAVDRLAGKGDSNVSVHFTVDRDGDAYQCGDLDQRLWHAGVSHIAGMTGLNDYYIGIEQANYGYWRTWKPNEWPKDFPRNTTLAEKEGWVHAAHSYDPSRVLYWEPYPEPLLASTEAICRWLLKNIPTIKAIHGHDQVSPGRKSDPGPAFPMNRFRALLMPDSETKPPKYKVVVAADDVLNVRIDASSSAAKKDWGPLKPGDIVEYLREQGSWYLIRRADKQEGWVNSLYLRRV